MESIVFLLAKEAKDNPQKPLFVDEEKIISYQESFTTIQRVASYFINKGIKGENILVSVSRNADCLLLFLGIALSGNTYVPFDETYPEERKKDILEIGKIKYGFSPSAPVVLKKEEAFKAPIVPLPEEKREDPCYLMFTSGSTGRPKGVLKSKGNVLAFLENFSLSFPSFPRGLSFCNQTPFSFDASAKDIYLTIATGGTLYIPSKDRFALPSVIAEYLEKNKIDVLLWVPSALTLFSKMKILDYYSLPSLKYVFFIGEPFMPKYLNYWITHCPKVHFYNWYGSTEVAGAILYHEIKEEVPLDSKIPIGKPLGNNEVFLENGEICVSSPQVALGYLEEKEKNALTFRNENGKRVLHTGDYGEIDRNGDFVFASRKDDQVKHMGYRIELSDIDVVLSSLPYIETGCTVLNRKRDRLVYFCSLNEKMENPIPTILKEAKEKLAFYMVPNEVKILPSLPLNPNGKVDRLRLSNSVNA